jgi:hypothetical protein
MVVEHRGRPPLAADRLRVRLGPRRRLGLRRHVPRAPSPLDDRVVLLHDARPRAISIPAEPHREIEAHDGQEPLGEEPLKPALPDPACPGVERQPERGVHRARHAVAGDDLAHRAPVPEQRLDARFPAHREARHPRPHLPAYLGGAGLHVVQPVEVQGLLQRRRPHRAAPERERPQGDPPVGREQRGHRLGVGPRHIDRHAVLRLFGEERLREGRSQGRIPAIGKVVPPAGGGAEEVRQGVLVG